MSKKIADAVKTYIFKELKSLDSFSLTSLFIRLIFLASQSWIGTKLSLLCLAKSDDLMWYLIRYDETKYIMGEYFSPTNNGLSCYSCLAVLAIHLDHDSPSYQKKQFVNDKMISLSGHNNIKSSCACLVTLNVKKHFGTIIWTVWGVRTIRFLLVNLGASSVQAGNCGLWCGCWLRCSFVGCGRCVQLLNVDGRGCILLRKLLTLQGVWQEKHFQLLTWREQTNCWWQKGQAFLKCEK